MGCSTDVSFSNNDVVSWLKHDDQINPKLDTLLSVNNDSDTEYLPSDGEDDLESEYEYEVSDVGLNEGLNSIHLDTNFIISWACILPLLRFCSKCLQPTANVKRTVVRGVGVFVELVCSAQHVTT